MAFILKNPNVNDCEIYPNYSLFAFKNVKSGKITKISMRGKKASLDPKQRKKLIKTLVDNPTFGFNLLHYDMVIMMLALSGYTCKQLFKASNIIITNGLRDWQSYKEFGINPPRHIDFFDIMQVAPAIHTSLKLYMARMHSRKLQDLPIAVGTVLTARQMDAIDDYCENDLDGTIELYKEVLPRLELRETMSDDYGLNLMSKSDAQIAEAVIKSELKSMGVPDSRLKAPKIDRGYTFKYKPPKYINFKTKQMRRLLKSIKKTRFGLSPKMAVILPDFTKGFYDDDYPLLSKSSKKKLLEDKVNSVKIGSTWYKLGIGGLHSKEKAQSVIPSKKQLLIDKDVASYYPAIILNLKVVPKHLGPKFFKIYKSIVKTRLKAKASGNKTVSDSLKITLNGAFGKLGSQWSVMYSPENMIAVTLTGQLSLLMLIEELEFEGFRVVSANTDGFVTLIKKKDYKRYEAICKKWENMTNLVLEEARYKGLYSKDVNNYFAVTEDYIKRKGVFVKKDLKKNPFAPIVGEAVIKFITEGVPLKATIKASNDIKDFVLVKNVRGGAVYGDEYLGRVARWVYGKNGKPISYKTNGNQVGSSEDAIPLMTFKKSSIKLVDRKKYVTKAEELLINIGLGS